MAWLLECATRCARSDGQEKLFDGATGEAALAEVMAMLAEEKALQCLDVAGRLMGDDCVVQLAEALEGNASLRLLQLEGNCIGDMAASRLAEMFKCNETLRSLDLDMNRIGDVGAAELAAALSQNQALNSLELHSNAIGAQGAAKLAEALRPGHNVTLRTLSLTDNKVRDEGAVYFAEALAENVTLCGLFLGKNEIGDQGGSRLAEMLKGNKCLQELHLERNAIGDAGAVQFGLALEENQSLRELWLSDNPIDDATVTTLSSSLMRNRGLNRLGLSIDMKTESGKESFKALRKAHHVRRALQELQSGSKCSIDLTAQEINDDDAVLLAEAVERVATSETQCLLESLVADNNCITDTGASRLAEALRQVPSIRTLSLMNNMIGHEGVRALQEVFANLIADGVQRELRLEGNPGIYDDLDEGLSPDQCQAMLSEADALEAGYDVIDGLHGVDFAADGYAADADAVGPSDAVDVRAYYTADVAYAGYAADAAQEEGGGDQGWATPDVSDGEAEAAAAAGAGASPGTVQGSIDWETFNKEGSPSEALLRDSAAQNPGPGLHSSSLLLQGEHVGPAFASTCGKPVLPQGEDAVLPEAWQGKMPGDESQGAAQYVDTGEDAGVDYAAEGEQTEIFVAADDIEQLEQPECPHEAASYAFPAAAAAATEADAGLAARLTATEESSAQQLLDRESSRKSMTMSL
eukprot:TRINITY_DN26045_c0_g1_i1.p1 TRINITY_DN26045_c0_g1~~TRINITY_DN26045_c0_g1_i1.p1  ORF type:complete len:695 (-),score=209.78 TRINITY_DN26045_c0_g1_i1:123-2207(-)